MHSSVCSYGYFCLITAGSFCFQYITLDFALSSYLRGQFIANCLDEFLKQMTQIIRNQFILYSLELRTQVFLASARPFEL